MRYSVATSTFILVWLAACGLAAADELDHNQAMQAVRDGRALPLRHILDMAEKAHGGELIEAELENEHGRLIYEIKLVTADGRLLKLVYDAADGSLLKSKERKSDRGKQ